MDNVTRREFVKKTAIATAGISAVSSYNILGAKSIKNKKIKLGVIGCGGRSTGAIQNHLDAAKLLGLEVDIVAIADVFEDKVQAVGEKYSVDASRHHTGYEAYKKVVESNADIVIMATPPTFRPVHLEACIEGGKHCFVEKPVAVDPVGARKVIEVGERAKAKGLTIVAGTQRRYDKKYREVKAMLDSGAIGDVLGGAIYWNGKVPWISSRKSGQSDAHYITRNWLNFAEMSGDHIVEQHIHQMDVANWFVGRTPVAIIGMGGRARRETGNQYDFFCVDFDYGEGVHINSQCRQIAGTYSKVGETFRGADGYTVGTKVNGKKVDIAPIEQEHYSGIVQEHVDLIKSTRGKGEPLNRARQVADATLCAIGGRISAYTGKLVRWVDMMENTKSPFYDFSLSPAPLDFERGKISMPEEVPAVPGEEIVFRER